MRELRPLVSDELHVYGGVRFAWCLDRIAVVAGAHENGAVGGGAEVHLVHGREILNDRQRPTVRLGRPECDDDMTRNLKRQVQPGPIGERVGPGANGGHHRASRDGSAAGLDADDAVILADQPQRCGKALDLDTKADGRAYV